MTTPRLLHGELTCEAGSPQEFAQLASDWLAAVREGLFPEIDRGLKADPELNPAHLTDIFATWGPPNAVRGYVHVRQRPTLIGGRHFLYSQRAWHRMLNSLATAYPFHIELDITPLGPDGRPACQGWSAAIGVHRQHEAPAWIRLEATAPQGITAWPGGTSYDPAAIQQTWAEFFKNQADCHGACYGHVTDDASIYGTALERATQPIGADPVAVPLCREVLRGYSWVTICAAELTVRLGGAASLATTGAFDQISELAGGQLFLRATQVLEDYHGSRLRRVFEALAPVLLTGRPNPDLVPAGARLLLDVDAAEYQRPP